MGAIWSPRMAGTPASGPVGRGALRVVVLAAALVAAPVRPALAQQGAFIKASADVTTSMVGALFVPDAPGLTTRGGGQPTVQTVRITGVGVVTVQAGPGEAIQVAQSPLDPRDLRTRVLQIYYVGT
jgi:hypothetical protein